MRIASIIPLLLLLGACAHLGETTKAEERVEQDPTAQWVASSEDLLPPADSEIVVSRDRVQMGELTITAQEMIGRMILAEELYATDLRPRDFVLAPGKPLRHFGKFYLGSPTIVVDAASGTWYFNDYFKNNRDGEWFGKYFAPLPVNNFEQAAPNQDVPGTMPGRGQLNDTLFDLHQVYWSSRYGGSVALRCQSLENVEYDVRSEERVIEGADTPGPEDDVVESMMWDVKDMEMTIHVIPCAADINAAQNNSYAPSACGKNVEFDECHRSQFGEAQKNLKKKFKKFYQFGFTGTPIFPENALGAETTASVFGRELHSYVITDAIRDEKVLKFKVDYNDVRPQYKAIETEKDEKKLSAAENKQALLHPDRIREITQYILNNFRQKTHRLQAGNQGFNAMFAVSSVDAAKLYYESFRELQKSSDKPLRVATIFSFAANEEQNAVGDIQDESFDVSAMNSSAKEFLSAAIEDYNALFRTNFSVDSNGFQNYYRDLAKQVKAREIDLLIVVGMFLTGFDAPTLNTLFVDKNLRYHGLMQAYSRTNRIFDATKTFGNIVTFRDLEHATIDAITLFGDKNTKNVVLEKSYKEYMEGFTEVATGEARRGFVDVVKELETSFPDPAAIEKETDKKAFAKLFGEYLRIENVLQNYDEFASLKAFQDLDMDDAVAVEAFKARHYLSDDDLVALQGIKIPAEGKIQDYRSTYNDVRDWLRREKAGAEKEKSTIDWDDVVFEVDLLKSQEINLDYILELIFEHNKKIKSKTDLVDEVRRVIRASLGNRAKESLLVDFINQTDLDQIGDKASVIDAFFTFAQAEQRREAQELISAENLNAEAARRYITTSLKREFASDSGTELNAVLPKMSPLNPQYLSKKQSVFQKIAAFVEKFRGVGGQV